MHNPLTSRPPAIDANLIAPEQYRAFQSFLQTACGILLGPNKEYLVVSRLSGIMAEQGFASLGELIRALQAGGSGRLKSIIVDAMTTNETFWFRDAAHFRIFAEDILPSLDAQRRPIRIWSAACSSGQEPYSISMVVEDYRRIKPGRLARDAEIVGTDISTRIVAEARTGIYCGMSVSRGLNSQQRNQYFVPREECLQVKPEIQRRVNFRELNLNNDFSGLGRFDVIFCRNVLIYFSSDLKQDILTRMAKSLNPGGYLFLGSTEALNGVNDRFEMVASHGGIAYRLKS